MTALDDNALAQFVALSAAAIQLVIPLELQGEVLDNARILADHAARVLDCEIPPETEIAPEFRP